MLTFTSNARKVIDMKAISEETRIKMRRSALLRCTDEWRKKRSDSLRTKVDDATLKKLYGSGLTQHEVAQCMGVSQKVIFSAMKRAGIKPRAAAKRNQKGQCNNSWKGDNAGYQALHLRLTALFGKPKICAICGNTSAKWYDWANLTGKYADISDYKRMCRSCHRKYDNNRRRKEVVPNV